MFPYLILLYAIVNRKKSKLVLVVCEGDDNESCYGNFSIPLRSSKTWYFAYIASCSGLAMDILKVDALAWWKNSKRHFLGDISKSFQEVTPMGPEPHHFFSFWNISTNMVARGIQSFGRNRPWLAGWLSNGQNFFLKFAHTSDKQMLKISSRYLDSCLI